MNYAKIDRCEYVNGNGIGVSLYVSGCHFHCPGCFNQDAWDFNYGKEWNEEAVNKLLEYANKPYINRVTILGGEPLAKENASEIINIVKKIKEKFPDKKIWLYTGFTWKQIFNPAVLDILDSERDTYIDTVKNIVSMCDVLVDGKYIEALHDATLKWRGSSNQRVINVQKTLETGKIVLYNN